MASTSCGSPGSVMCHPQHRPTGAWRPVGCFPCAPAGRTLGGWMPFLETQGQVTGTLSPSDSLCAEKPQPHRCPPLCVLGLRGLAGTAWSPSIFFFFSSLFLYTCVHSPDPIAHTPVAIFLRLVPTHTIKVL